MLLLALLLGSLIGIWATRAWLKEARKNGESPSTKEIVSAFLTAWLHFAVASFALEGVLYVIVMVL